MKQLQATTLVDALSQWGQHEAEGRFKQDLAFAPQQPADYLNVLLHTRPLMVAHLMNRKPSSCVQVELEPGDDTALRLSNGMTLDDWMAHLHTEAKADSLAHIQQLVEAQEAPQGPVLVVASVVDTSPPSETTRLGAVALYDGWHRTAAWLIRCRQQRPSPLLANLVITPEP